MRVADINSNLSGKKLLKSLSATRSLCTPSSSAVNEAPIQAELAWQSKKHRQLLRPPVDDRNGYICLTASCGSAKREDFQITHCTLDNVAVFFRDRTTVRCAGSTSVPDRNGFDFVARIESTESSHVAARTQCFRQPCRGTSVTGGTNSTTDRSAKANLRRPHQGNSFDSNAL